MEPDTKPAKGISTYAALVTALAAAVPVVIQLLDGIETIAQAIVVVALLIVVAAVLVAMIISRGRQATALAIPPRAGTGE